jgi:hypothetical protein
VKTPAPQEGVFSSLKMVDQHDNFFRKDSLLITTAPPARTPPATGGNDLAFAFNQGIPKAAVIRLLRGTHTPADRAMYYRADWWAAKKAETLKAFGHQCALCGSSLALQVHHKPQAYKRLFRERPVLDLTVACARCHRHHHRK